MQKVYWGEGRERVEREERKRETESEERESERAERPASFEKQLKESLENSSVKYFFDMSGTLSSIPITVTKYKKTLDPYS